MWNELVRVLTGIEVCVCVHLQNEDEEVDAFPVLVKVVLRRAFVVVVELEFLDDVGVSEDPQQDFLCDLERAEQADLWGRSRAHREEGGQRHKPGLSTRLIWVSRKRRRPPPAAHL